MMVMSVPLWLSLAETKWNSEMGFVQTVLFAARQRLKMQIKLSISTSHGIPTSGQPDPALTPMLYACVCVYVCVCVFKCVCVCV